uniref:SWIM-type domain-containing protein n=1 Tax=Lactuca sativa TaxID=4236 RepID=A0A9R1UH00_LACSA|nr:hypothetical protein LSAT_V11C900499280 [Lactuca sativa]
MNTTDMFFISIDNSTQDSEGGYEDTSDENESDNQSGRESESSDECVNNRILYSPGGSSKLWKPTVAKEIMPDEHVTFESLTHAINVYRKYAEHAGFDVRLNTTTRFRHDKSIKIKYVVCNRAGKIPDRSLDTMDTNNGGRKHRNSNFIVTDCKALIKFERVGVGRSGFQIREFQELHNHPLYTTEEHKEFIIRATTANVGATKAHKLRAALKGGYECVGPEESDFKNFRKKLGNIIGNKDAQLVVNKMNERKTHYPDYSFEYKCVDSVLNAMFWADETYKVFYKEFGDVISFDATFRTNKYGMVFVPFTTIDNHKRSVTVGAGLLSNEKIESYCWLLEAFLKAHGKAPTLVLTDQDPSILQAVEAVFPNAQHRLCLWHITKKLQVNVCCMGNSLTYGQRGCFEEHRFQKTLQQTSVEYIYLDTLDFETVWKSLMQDHNLQDKRWFKDMYHKRTSWIPAYFKDMPMHGLMKTTSRFESVNSFFNKYSHHGNFLLYFMVNYDTTIGKQCNTQRPKVYTNTIFAEIRKEIYKGAWNCSIDSVENINGWQVVMITHLDKRRHVKTKCKVELKLPEKEVKCTCDLFKRMGILCRHVFAVLKNHHIEEIPEQYILRRWRRDIISSHLLVSKNGLVGMEDETFKLLTKEYSNMEYSLERLKNDKEKLEDFVKTTRTMRSVMEHDPVNNVALDESDEVVFRLFGVSIPEDIDINVPPVIHNKGSGTKKRMVSASERATTSSKSGSRRCT